MFNLILYKLYLKSSGVYVIARKSFLKDIYTQTSVIIVFQLLNIWSIQSAPSCDNLMNYKETVKVGYPTEKC